MVISYDLQLILTRFHLVGQSIAYDEEGFWVKFGVSSDDLFLKYDTDGQSHFGRPVTYQTFSCYKL